MYESLANFMNFQGYLQFYLKISFESESCNIKLGLPISPIILGQSGTFGKHMWNVLKRFASVQCLSFLADSIHQQTRYLMGLQEILQSGEEFGCKVG